MEHTRIDEGVKRGPRSKRKPRRTEAAIAANRIIPIDLLPAAVIDRYLNDEKTSTIAASYGVSRSRLHQWLLEHAEEHWRKAQVARAVTALEDAKDQLDSASDALELAQARERLRGAQWELERLFSRLFGAKQEVSVTIDHQVSVEHSLTADASELLGRIRKGNAASLKPPIDVTPDPAQSQPIDPTQLLQGNGA